MKKYITLIYFCALTFMGFTQNSVLTGTVVGDEGEVLIGASVEIDNLYKGDYTNENGVYTIPNIKDGLHTVTCKYLGFKTFVSTVTISGETVFDISLNVSSLVLDQIVVSALKAQDNTPVAKTNISKSDIEANNVTQDIPYQLELTPSVVATSENGTGMGYTNMRIRGTDMTRINVTMNGIPLNDAESQGVFWVNMADFASSIEEVQIQRGVGTSTNGAASFGASINFQTLGITEKPYAKISSNVGSFNTFKENITVGSGIIDSAFAVTLRLSKLNSDGWVQRGFSDHQSAHLTASYFNKKSLLTANILLGKEITGITWWGVPDYIIDSEPTFNPAGEYTDDNGDKQYYKGQTDNYWQNHYILNYSREISKHIDFVLGLHYTTGKGYYEQYIPRFDDWGDENLLSNYGLNPIILGDTISTIAGTQYVFPDSTITSSDMIRQKWLDNDFYGYTANFHYKKNRVDLSVGTSFNIYEGDHFGKIKWIKFNPALYKEPTWYFNIGEKKDLNGFAKIQYQATPKLSLYGDLQLRTINYKMQGPDDDLVNIDQEHTWNFKNPKAGAYYKFDFHSSAFVSFAVAHREPSRADLKEASKAGGNEFPKAETLKDLEIGYQYNEQKHAFGINFYHMMYDNQLVNTGQVNSVGYPIMTNVENSHRTGVEFSVGVKPNKHFEWNGNITVSENKIENYYEYAEDYDNDWNKISKITNMGTTDISYSPDLIASSSFMIYPDKKMSFGITSKYVGEQYLDNTSDEVRKLDAYLVHNLQITYHHSLKNNKDKLHIQLLVNNLLDTKYISNGYGGNWYEQGKEYSWLYLFPQAGINYMLKLTLEI